VNKSDLNPSVAQVIEKEALAAGALFVTSVRYDRAVTEAMVAGGSVVDRLDGGVAGDLVSLWELTRAALVERVRIGDLESGGTD
jgi:N-acetylglucosamine kinase-like BadF-type ATPase